MNKEEYLEGLKFKTAWYEWLRHIVEKHWSQKCKYTNPEDCWKLLPHGEALIKDKKSR